MSNRKSGSYKSMAERNAFFANRVARLTQRRRAQIRKCPLCAEKVVWRVRCIVTNKDSKASSKEVRKADNAVDTFERWPRVGLCVNNQHPSTRIIIDELWEAGFRTVTAPVAGILEPDLYFEHNIYRGVKEIRAMILRYKERTSSTQES